ncbi:hypothetical protein D3C71_1508480 [compost metagenome]
MLPAPSIIRAPKILFTVRPYLMQCTPPAFSARFPPMVHALWLEGSGAKNKPSPSANSDTTMFRTPGPTTTWQAAGKSEMVRRRFSPITTLLLTGVAPPDRLVPAPRGVTAIRCSAQYRSTSQTSASLARSTTAIGRSQRWKRASHS